MCLFRVLEGLMLLMTSHGSMLMKPSVHHKRCRVVTFLGELLLLFSIIDAPEMFLLLLKMDEVEDPHDDAEVSECEEAGNVPATDQDDAADLDEFDDGF